MNPENVNEKDTQQLAGCWFADVHYAHGAHLGQTNQDCNNGRWYNHGENIDPTPAPTETCTGLLGKYSEGADNGADNTRCRSGNWV